MSSVAAKLVSLLLAASILGCRGPRQWAETDTADSGDAKGTIPASGGNGGNSPGPDGRSPAPADGPAADIAAVPPPDPNLRRLTVTVSGPGELTADGQPLACPDTCVIDRPPGTPVTLTARPAKTGDRPISLFLGWSGACTGKAGCVVTLDAAKNLGVAFHRFVVWEEAARLLRISVVGGALYGTGTFSGMVSLAGSSFTSAGPADGVVARIEEDGRVAWARTVTGPGRESVGLVMPGATPTEIRLQAQVEASGTFGTTQLEPGKLLLTLSSGGDLQRSVKTEHEWEGSPFGNGFAFVPDNNGGDRSLLRVDDTGRVLWTKPPLGTFGFRAGHVCDRAGNVIAMHALASEITVAGQTFTEEQVGTAASLLVKLSPQGDAVWATKLSATRFNASPICDASGDVYLSAVFMGTLRVGTRSQQTRSTDQDVAVAKLRGATPEVLWLTAFGSIVDDVEGALAFDAAGKVLFAPRFADAVTIAGETFPAATIVIRLDPATGMALSAFDAGRRVYELAPHPTSGAYFSGLDTFGRLALPP